MSRKSQGKENPGGPISSDGRGPGSENPPRSVLLVVDDEADTLESLETLFRESLPGVEVLTAQTAKEGEEIVRTQKVDLVLVDYKLPDRSGAEFLKKVRE